MPLIPTLVNPQLIQAGLTKYDTLLILIIINTLPNEDSINKYGS